MSGPRFSLSAFSAAAASSALRRRSASSRLTRSSDLVATGYAVGRWPSPMDFASLDRISV